MTSTSLTTLGWSSFFMMAISVLTFCKAFMDAPIRSRRSSDFFMTLMANSCPHG